MLLSSPKNSWNLLVCCFHWNSLKSFLWTFLLPPLKLKCRNLEGAPCTLNSIKQLKDWWRSCYHLCWQHGLEVQRSIWSSYKHFFFARGELGKLIECYFQMLQSKDLFLWVLFFFFLLTKVSWIVASKWYSSFKNFYLMNTIMVLDVHYCGHVITTTKYFNFLPQCLSWNLFLIVFL